MALPVYVIRPSIRCLRRTRMQDSFILSLRNLHYLPLEAAPIESINATPSPQPPPLTLDPSTSYTRKEEHLLAAQGRMPIGSRRRRAALRTSGQIPFEELPYQCFQEARKIIAADRETKLEQIEEERRRIAKVKATSVSKLGGEGAKRGKLVAMHKYLEELKILADINDPVIKKRFEDGQGDMNRPIYRYLADKQWRSYRRKVQLQRITQMHIVPDILPHLDMSAEVTLRFGQRAIQPGSIVDSWTSEKPPQIRLQVFDRGARRLSIAVVNPDVPNLETDGFDYRCHFLAVNIPFSHLDSSIPLPAVKNNPSQLVLPWLAPFAQKGSPYQRMAVFVLQHQEGQEIDAEAVRKRVKREGFNLRRFNDQFKMTPIGAALFRTVWDENTPRVMEDARVEGANIELVRKDPEKLPYKRPDGARYRGWKN